MKTAHSKSIAKAWDYADFKERGECWPLKLNTAVPYLRGWLAVSLIGKVLCFLGAILHHYFV